MAGDLDGRATGVEPVAERSVAENVRLGLGVALLAALALFFAQNFDDAKISFLWFDREMPLVVALLISALFGSLATWLLVALRGRAERKRQEAMFDSAMRGAKK
jgi:uncharacterized integral membrane protein